MVKCLIRITTRVNVHLRMINHCYRDVKVRVLSLGPRLLGKALGVLPLYPALTGPQGSDKITPLSGASLPSVQPSNPPGKLTTEPARSVLYMDWPVLYSKLVCLLSEVKVIQVLWSSALPAYWTGKFKSLLSYFKSTAR